MADNFKIFCKDIYNISTDIYSELGSGFNEAVYQNALGIEFRKRNIKYLKQYGICSISSKMIDKSHLTSKKTASNESEYKLFDIEKDYIDNFPVPFAKESQIKIGLNFIEEKFIVNKCRLIVGEVEIIKINSSITKSGNLNFEELDGITITGISTYNKIKNPIEMPYAKSK